MRSSLFVALLLFIVIAAVSSGPLPSKQAEELVQDGNNDVSKIAKEDGKGAVKLIGPGYVDLVVSSGSLMVGVDIKGCKGKVLFCYPAKSGEMMKDATDLCRAGPGYCGFQLDGTENGKITLTLITIALKDVSCNAATSAEDGRIRIHVKDVDSDNCPVSIKYAKIYVPPTTTPVPTTAPPSKPTSSNGTIMKNDDKAADASSQELTWIVLGCLIGVIILGLIGGILLCRFKKWCMFKKNTAETLPPPVESIVSTTVTTKADENVTVEEKPKEEMTKAKKPETIAAASKKSENFLPLAPTPPSAEPSKKLSPPPPSAKKTKEKKEKKSPATAASPSKKAPKEKKVAPAPPGKKPAEKQRVPASSAGKKISKEATEKQSDSTQSYSAPFGLVPFRAASPPRRPIDPERRGLGSKKDSLELPSFSGGKPVYCQYAREKQRKEKAAAEAWKKKLRNEKVAAAEARKEKNRSQKK